MKKKMTHQGGNIRYAYIACLWVLGYILHWFLHRKDSRKQDELAERRALMLELRENRKHVYLFWEEFRDRFAWDLLPFDFLYDLYKAWQIRYDPEGNLMDFWTFSNELQEEAKGDAVWAATQPDGAAVTTGNKMDKPEMLIAEYDLKDWSASTNNPIRCCIPRNVQKEYKGLYRNHQTQPAAYNGGD